MQRFLWTMNTSSQPFMHDLLRSPSHEQDPGDVTPSWAGCPTHAQWAEQYTYQHREADNQQGRPPDRGPHRTQARRPRVPCDICPQYGIISTLKIPAVSSGATWTLSLRNFLWTCITQVQSTFATNLAVIKFQIYCCVPNFIQIGWFFVKIWPFDDLRIWGPSAILCFRNVDFMSRDLCHHVTSVAMLFCFPAQNFT